eukprot:scaffold7349_cov129-Skeletonema_dohrnii-CCMP3373.AAC.12
MKARYILYNREKNEDTDTVKFPEGQIVAIYLAALPDAAKRPQLCIDKITMREMIENERNELDSSSLDCNGEDIVVHFYHPSFHVTSRCKAKELKAFYQSFSKKELLDLVLGSAQTINAIAKGERGDLYQVIKECMKQKKSQIE